MPLLLSLLQEVGPEPRDFSQALGPTSFGPFDAVRAGLDPGTPLGLVWLALLAAGTVAGCLTVFVRRLPWPPRVLRAVLLLSVAGLAVDSFIYGLPPLFPVLQEDGEPRLVIPLITGRALALTLWLTHVWMAAAVLGLRSILDREWRRLASAGVFVLPYLVLVSYGRSRLGEIAMSASPGPAESSFLTSFFRHQYLWTSAALAFAVLVFLVVEWVESRSLRNSSNEPDT